MNQILISNINSDKKEKNSKKSIKNKVTFLKFQFFLCITLTFIAIFYYAYSLYNNSQKETLSQKLSNNFSITKLYSDSSNYSMQDRLADNTYQTSEDTFSVIGLIEINRIQINYPILSEVNNELLKIAPCKFYGPMPNEVGNLCIART